MNEGRRNSKTNIGIHGHAGGTRPGQTHKTPKNLSAHASEECGSEESVGLYPVYMCERGECGIVKDLAFTIQNKQHPGVVYSES